MTTKQLVYAIIPARSGSKGVPNKNIMDICGHPLIAYSISAAKKCKLIDRVIVSTDSEEYAEIAMKYGAEVPFIRPKNISGDKATDTQFFQHAIDFFRKEGCVVPEFVAHLRPTTPLRSPLIIDKAIKKFINSKYSALRSVHKMSDTSYKTFEIENERLKVLCNKGFDIESTNLPRQSFATTYKPNGYIDVIRTSLIECGLAHGDNVNAFITDIAYEIDEKIDLDFIEFLINKGSIEFKILFNK
jgi:CMP-N,N'-diacetyllegionaminic acid synthase